MAPTRQTREPEPGVTPASLAADYRTAAADPQPPTMLGFALDMLAADTEEEFYAVCLAHSEAAIADEITDGAWFTPLTLPRYDTPVHFGRVVLDTRRRLGLPSPLDDARTKHHRESEAVAAARKDVARAERNDLARRMRDVAASHS